MGIVRKARAPRPVRTIPTKLKAKGHTWRAVWKLKPANCWMPVACQPGDNTRTQ